jgi:hypothetical protein
LLPHNNHIAIIVPWDANAVSKFRQTSSRPMQSKMLRRWHGGIAANIAKLPDDDLGRSSG